MEPQFELERAPEPERTGNPEPIKRKAAQKVPPFSDRIR
jgi:hypothetical protein